MLRYLFAAMILMSGCGGPDEPMKQSSFYIGTYTSETSEGIYYAGFDPQTGGFSDLKLAAVAPNPSFLALTGENLYAVNEDTGQPTGSVTRFTIESPGTLVEAETISSEGKYPCYISLTDSDRKALVANYGTGNVLCIRLDASGAFGNTFSRAHSGSGPDSSRQESAHAHYFRQMPDKSLSLAADLGTDRVYQYELTENDVVLKDSLVMSPGSGPRHIDHHPSIDVFYVINELSAMITVFSATDSGYVKIQEVSTLPGDFNGENSCADIHAHPNGKWLYASNRGHDSIVSYRIAQDGTIEATGFFQENVNWPRNFAVSPEGSYLVIANQKGNSVISARINETDGTLSATGKSLTVSQPVCIRFE